MEGDFAAIFRNITSATEAFTGVYSPLEWKFTEKEATQAPRISGEEIEMGVFTLTAHPHESDKSMVDTGVSFKLKGRQCLFWSIPRCKRFILFSAPGWNHVKVDLFNNTLHGLHPVTYVV